MQKKPKLKMKKKTRAERGRPDVRNGGRNGTKEDGSDTEVQHMTVERESKCDNTDIKRDVIMGTMCMRVNKLRGNTDLLITHHTSSTPHYYLQNCTYAMVV